MRADIHDGPEHMLQSETEYIDARPHQPASTKSLLHHTAGPYIGSNSDLTAAKCDFRYAPESRLKSDIAPCPKRAKPGHDNGPEGRKKSRLAAASQIQICKSIGPL